MNSILETLINLLERIAKDNDDHFRYRIDITRPGKPVYEFVAEETADKHVFVSGRGNDIEDAALSALAAVTEACRQWGYTL